MSGRKISILCGALAIVALVLAFTFAPGQVEKVVAQATVVYNLYATDGYYELPDGQPLYMYGFIGGREGVDFTYQTSCIPGKKDKITGLATCAGSTNVTVTGGPVAPQGGPWVGQDTQFAGDAQFPAPIIYSTVGDVVEIRLKNLGVSANPAAPNDPHSIHLHGLDVDAANDGVPETSLGAVPANLCTDGTTAGPAGCGAVGSAPGAGNVIVYMYTAEHAGTYMYHCHQEADIHVQMGMFGALVAYNPGDPAAATGPGQGQGGTLYDLNYDKDYVLLLSEFDPRGHASEAGTYAPNSWDPKPYNWALYKPQYWSINGLSFPQTIHAAFPSGYTFAQWLAAHPGYDPLVTGSVSTPNVAWGTPGEKVLLRVINMGFETHPMHMHGYHAKVIGSDQRGWDWTNYVADGTAIRPFNEGMEKNTLVIGSGETYEWLIDFGQQSFQSTYPGGTLSRFNNTLGPADPVTGVKPLLNVKCDPNLPLNAPVPNTNTACPPIPDFGDPANAGVLDYIGGPVVTGLVGHPATNQYFPFHNHDDYKATNNGVYPGGMFTMIVPTP
jgi:FtsP/CotA-like multicopper oxidase with cupredoxin domain